MSDYKPVLSFAEGGAALMIDALPKAKEMLGDRGYDADWFRGALTERGITPCIPSKANRKIAIPHDRTLYRQRQRLPAGTGAHSDQRASGSRAGTAGELRTGVYQQLSAAAAATAAAVPPSSCGPSNLAAQTGRFHVVIRGPDGRLLNRVSPYGEARTPAFAFVPVTLDKDNHWLRAVLGAVPQAGEANLPNVLYLRDGTGAAKVEASLRRAGITPIAAYVQGGERLDEVRPSDGEVGSPWLTRAVPLGPRLITTT